MSDTAQAQATAAPAGADEGEALHEDHFESLRQQREAARLGMWVFLASEVLLFSGLIALYSAQRAEHPHGFAEGVRHADIVIGSVNTFILLISSYLVARAVHALRGGARKLAAGLTGGSVLLGLAFLGLKALEYTKHIAEGAVPGGRTEYFAEHPAAGLPAFYNLYWISTFTHAVHVVVGVTLLGWLAWWAWRRADAPERAHRLEMGALYWHLVDSIWIFLWPLYYLMR